jgi:hypothetical protein
LAGVEGTQFSIKHEREKRKILSKVISGQSEMRCLHQEEGGGKKMFPLVDDNKTERRRLEWN